MCEEEGRLGSAVDRQQERHVRRAHRGVRGGGRHLLLWQFCFHLLAQEARSNARTHFQQ